MWQQEDALRILADLSEPAPRMTTVVRRLHEAGVRILAGTDTPNPFIVPGASLHEELHHLLEAGFTPEEAWVAATRWAGESLGEPKLGTLEEGAPADLLIFREDPSHDLAALSTLEAVVAQGRLYSKGVLDRAIQRHRDYSEGWFYDRVSMALARMFFWLLGIRGETRNNSGTSPGAPAAQQGAAAAEPQRVRIGPCYRLAANAGDSSEPRRRCGSLLSAGPLGGGARLLEASLGRASGFPGMLSIATTSSRPSGFPLRIRQAPRVAHAP